MRFRTVICRKNNHVTVLRPTTETGGEWRCYYDVIAWRQVLRTILKQGKEAREAWWTHSWGAFKELLDYLSCPEFAFFYFFLVKNFVGRINKWQSYLSTVENYRVLNDANGKKLSSTVLERVREKKLTLEVFQINSSTDIFDTKQWEELF